MVILKLIVAGSRGWNDYTSVSNTLNEILPLLYERLKPFTVIEIVSGTAEGADLLGERYALENNHTIKRFPADWEKYGLSAGYRRNVDMANYADACVVFWDGKSKGTKHMIEISDKHGIPCFVVKYSEEKENET